MIAGHMSLELLMGYVRCHSGHSQIMFRLYYQLMQVNRIGNSFKEQEILMYLTRLEVVSGQELGLKVRK